jgi:hypothetical protein
MDQRTVDEVTRRGPFPSRPAGPPEPQSLIAALRGLFFILAADAPRYTIVAASDAYLHATRSTRDGPQESWAAASEVELTVQEGPSCRDPGFSTELFARRAALGDHP